MSHRRKWGWDHFECSPGGVAIAVVLGRAGELMKEEAFDRVTVGGGYRDEKDRGPGGDDCAAVDSVPRSQRPFLRAFSGIEAGVGCCCRNLSSPTWGRSGLNAVADDQERAECTVHRLGVGKIGHQGGIEDHDIAPLLEQVGVLPSDCCRGCGNGCL